MKKILFFALVMSIATSVSFAAEVSGSTTGTTVNQSAGENIVLQIVGDVVIPTGDLSSAFNEGAGFEVLIGKTLDSELTLGVLSGYQAWVTKISQDGTNVGYIPIEAVAKYNLGNDKIRPYLILGAGVAIDVATYTSNNSSGVSSSATDFLLDPGIGVAFALSNKTDLVIQGKVAIDFATGTTNVSIPIQLGLNFNL